MGLSTAVAVVTALGAGFLLGHAALAVVLPLMLLALWYNGRLHRHRLPLALGAVAAVIAYVHIFAHTPEWTQYLTAAFSLLAALADWRVSRPLPVAPAAAGELAVER